MHGGVNPHITQGSTECSLLVNTVKFSSVLSSTRRPEAGHKEPSLLCQHRRHGVLPSCHRCSAPESVGGEKQGWVGTQRGKPPGGNGAISWKCQAPSQRHTRALQAGGTWAFCPVSRENKARVLPPQLLACFLAGLAGSLAKLTRS